ncbi:MAG TPA: efflux transporter outer membrane subunit [Thermoanaerobaculia bacterium]|nr:efflux transporter outer membrane subunit [Thermoanaerobaculia bacterium]
MGWVRSWAVLATTGLAAAACAVGPHYKRPEAPVPAAFKEPPPGDWKPAQPNDAVLRGKWWEIFGDPALNALEEQVTVSNQNIAQAEAQFRGARAALGVVRAGLFPTVTAGASATRSRTPTLRAGAAGTSSSGETTVFQVPIDLSYEIDLWGRIRRNIEASAASAQASAADLENVRLSMHAELALDYFQLHGLDAQRQLLDTTVGGYQTALQLTTNRYNQGVVSGVDVAQAQTQLEQTRAQATELGVGRAQFEHAIAILTGKAPADLTIAAAPIGLSPPPIPVALPSALLERRPDVAAAERRVAAANAQIGVAQAAYFPTLSLTGSGGFESTKLAKLFSLPNRFWSLGSSLVETVFAGGKRRAAVEQARASYDATVAVYRQDVLTALEEVENNLAALRILAVEENEQAAAVSAAERSLALAKNRYQGGITTYLEVITAQNIALVNERAAVDILTRRMVASVNLIKALGGAWTAADLPALGAPIGR